jgi:YHYH protein
MRRLLLFVLPLCVLVAVLFVGGRFALSVYCEKAEPKVAAGDPLDPKRLPLGDGKYSTTAKRGYVMRCGNGPGFFGGGAFKDGPWIHADSTWDSTAKITVDGDVEWKNFRYEITVENGKRKLTGNGLPDHHTGKFPIDRDSEAFKYDRNPNRINETNIVFELPLYPQVAAQASCLTPGAIGVMKSGVAIFDGLDAQGKDAPAHEVQDKCSGHPEPHGQYHYHNLSNCIAEKATGKHSELVGYALDGFGIYGLYGEDGKELTDADLDECHGHTHEILWEGKTMQMYHYHATREYPYTLGCFKGTPVSNREGRRPPPPMGWMF